MASFTCSNPVWARFQRIEDMVGLQESGSLLDNMNFLIFPTYLRRNSDPKPSSLGYIFLVVLICQEYWELKGEFQGPGTWCWHSVFRVHASVLTWIIFKTPLVIEKNIRIQRNSSLSRRVESSIPGNGIRWADHCRISPTLCAGRIRTRSSLVISESCLPSAQEKDRKYIC